MTVSVVIRELEKIEILRGLDRIYRMDHAITKNQKIILKTFGFNAEFIKIQADRISEQLRIIDEGRQTKWQ